jgi:hypothetical protein
MIRLCRERNAMNIGENLTKAAQSAEFLCRDLQAAHRDCEDPALEMLLMDWIKQAAELAQRIGRVA